MSIYIWPENWEELEVDPLPIVELTQEERGLLKDEMKDYVNNKNKRVRLKQVIKVAHEMSIKDFGKHISDEVMIDIALEIREEYGYPGQEEEE